MQRESSRSQWGLDHPIRLVFDQGESQRDQARARQTWVFKERAARDPASTVCPFMELAKSRTLDREGTRMMSEPSSPQECQAKFQ